MTTARAIALLQEAIGLLSGQVNAPAVPTVANTAAAAAQYLRENTDVAAHAYYSTHPLEHFHMHGKAEGRKWPSFGTAVVEPVTHPAWPETESEAPQPTVSDDSPTLRNFTHLKETLGDDAAYDYLIKHVPGGAEMVRGMFADRQESARLVNKYAVGSQRGFVDDRTGEYVLGGNPWTKDGGQRVKLPG